MTVSWETGPEGWLVAERPVPGAETDTLETKYRLSTLPQDTSLERLVLLAHARWVIEQFYEDANQIGMRFRSLPGTQLAGTPSTSGSGPALLQFSHALSPHPAPAS